MSSYIINAAPMDIPLGTQDLSTRQLPRIPEDIPQHLPKFYIFAQKGPERTPVLCVGAERERVFGTPTFDVLDKYATHTTLFANLANQEANSCMLERLIPEDAGPNSTVIMWLDVLETTVDVYERNIDGSIKLDTNNDPIITGTTSGYKVKWVTTHYATMTDLQDFGSETIKPGNQVDPVTGATSQRYPIFGFKVASRGEYGNNVAFRLWAQTTDNTLNLPTKLMAEERVFPFNFSMLRRTNDKTTPKVIHTIFDEPSFMVGFKPNTRDPLTTKQTYIGDLAVQAYQNLTNPRYPAVYGDFGTMVIHQENLEYLLERFHTKEIPFIDQWSDFSDRSEDKFLFNFVSGVSTKNVPYHSFQMVDDIDAVRLSAYTNVYAKGGSDGTMTDDALAALVSERVVDYMDPNNELQDDAYHVESIMYDSGFPLQTKMDLATFISQRKDTFVVLSTFDVNDRKLLPSEEYSIAIALRTRLMMFVESEYFGTPTMRAMIMGFSGKLMNSLWTKRVPLTAEVLIKSSRYMGAGNGRWKNGFNFDGAPGSIIDSIEDISVHWVPKSVRNRNWDVGLNWCQRYDRRSFFFPALKTIYPEDTSILTSYFTALAICQVNKVTSAAHREFSGVSGLTNAQFIERINAFILKRLQGRFDSRYVMVPNCEITDEDALRGYSWITRVDFYGPNMKTVARSYVRAFRAEDIADSFDKERAQF